MTALLPDTTTSEQSPAGRVLSGRFMLPDTTEHPCQVRELTIDGAVFATELPPPAGLPIVAYIDSVGRIVGISDERVEGGFKVKFTLAGPTRARLASRLESLTKHPEATEHSAAVESAHQRALRYEPENSSSHLGLSDGRVYACEVVDISLTGAAIKTNIMPTLGTYVMLGKMRGRIVRYTDQGIAIEFVKPLDRTSLAEQIR